MNRIHHDRAAFLATAARQIFASADEPDEQQHQVEQLFRDEIADIERRAAADRRDWS
jgi:hypothetical protein